ncbi:MAG: glycosyltransferase family 4 protein, partial [Actinobacteria bacterium]
MGKILLVGGYPPPYGGISVHVKRLFEVLKRDHSVFVLDMYGDVCGERQGEIIRCGRFVPFNLFKALFFIKKINAEIVHCHVSAISKFLLAGIPIMFFAGDSARKIVTIHSGGFVKNIENFNIFQKTLFVFLIEKIDHVIV